MHLLLQFPTGPIYLGHFSPVMGDGAAILESKHPNAQEYARISSVDDFIPDFLSSGVNHQPQSTVEAMLLCSSERIYLSQRSSSAAQRRGCLQWSPQAAAIKQSLEERQISDVLSHLGHITA